MTAGSEWVDLDRQGMLKARRAEEAERLRHEGLQRRRREELDRRSQQEAQAILLELENASSRAEPPVGPRPGRTSGSMEKSLGVHPRRPAPLVRSLHVENLKSLSGAHDIPLAPLTLVFGPNASGKSTVLHALQLFFSAVSSGRHDALHLWDEAFKKFEGGGRDTATSRDLVTRSAAAQDDDAWMGGEPGPAPESLSLGVTFLCPDGRSGRAGLVYNSWYDDESSHSSILGYVGGDISAKNFLLRWEGWPTDLTEYFVGDVEAENLTKVRADNQLFGTAPPELQDVLFDLASHLKYLGPHRGSPGSYYMRQRGPFRAREDWGAPAFDLRERLNQMLRQLDVPYRFVPEEESRGSDGGLQLQDTRSGIDVRLDHVGYGISQLLPVVNTCIEAAEQIICVEEPEIHLHPRLAASLGNLFAHAVVARGNQVVVETHSESLLLRVRRLIRRGDLMPDEVAVLYVDNQDEAGASVRQIRLGRQGELLDPWPTGFFDDSVADVLGGWR